MINEVNKGLPQVATCLEDVIVFDPDPKAHVKTMRALFERLRKHNLELSLSKLRLGATDEKKSGPPHFDRGYAQIRKKIGFDEKAHAQESQTPPCADGRRGVLSQIPT